MISPTSINIKQDLLLAVFIFEVMSMSITKRVWQRFTYIDFIILQHMFMTGDILIKKDWCQEEPTCEKVQNMFSSLL